MPNDTLKEGRKPTPLFLMYAGQLVFRLALFGYCIYLFIVKPELLSPSEYFGIPHGFNSMDFIFLALFLDFSTKFFTRAKIAMGSLKQYPTYHVPTARTFQGGREALFAYFKRLVVIGREAFSEDGTLTDHGKKALEGGIKLLEEAWGEAREALDTTLLDAKNAVSETYSAVNDTRKSIMADARKLITNVDFLHMLKFREEDLVADDTLRTALHKDRMREVVPTAILWVLLNLAVAFALWHFDMLNEKTAIVWSLFYYVFDMICVVLWCPIQLVVMKNRCCTTCQIFNWDAAMVATPLLFVGGWFSAILIIMALVVLVRWELAAARRPERFDERTNALLQCANCKDQLCFIRSPYRNPERDRK